MFKEFKSGSVWLMWNLEFLSLDIVGRLYSGITVMRNYYLTINPVLAFTHLCFVCKAMF